MPNESNHFIVHCRKRRESAAFLADLVAAPAPFDCGRFTQFITTPSSSDPCLEGRTS